MMFNQASTGASLLVYFLAITGPNGTTLNAHPETAVREGSAKNYAGLKTVVRLMEPAGKEAKYSKARPDDAVVDVVVLHFCSDVVANQASPFEIDKVVQAFKNSKPPSSAHYLIDREGSVQKLVPEERQAYHAGKGELPAGCGLGSRTDALNATSIGIEMLAVGSADEMKQYLTPEQYALVPTKARGFTDSQYVALKALITDIAKRHDKFKFDRRHVIGHSDYAPGRKQDPGSLFDWNRLGLVKALAVTGK